MKRYIAGFIFLFFLPGLLTAQEENSIEQLLSEEVFNENPVYKPVIGIGTGVFNFYGDVRNNYINPLLGNFGYKVNLTSYLDNNRYYKLNLFFIHGQISANQRSVTDLNMNLNFKSEIVDFGINIEYDFAHLIHSGRFIVPYVSLGIENIQFTPKGDIINEDQLEYFYWSDGSIRDINEGAPAQAEIIHRDFTYETDLRARERDEFGLGSYSSNTFSVPLDLGLNFRISDRIKCKLGTSLHFTFSDYIDNVASEGTSITGGKGNDMFSYNYISLHFDLFSQPKSVIVEKMFAELEFDSIMNDDEDGDFILDAVDECPGTPYNVAVDSTGCPIDTDNDGIPDYLDKEDFSAAGAWVDENGVTITEEEFLAHLLDRQKAMSRDEVKAYFNIIGSGYVRKPVTEIPEKFVQLDKDKDEYISFDELLMAIDDYFDYNLDFRVEDIYELNNFFFNQ